MSGSTHGLIIMKNLKYIISAAAVAFLVYIFTFYLDGEMGVILLAFVLFAPLVSFGFAYYAKKNVTVSIDCDGYVQKGSKLKVTVRVSKNNAVPLAILEIKPYISEVFQQNDKTYKLSLMGAGDRTFTFETEALYGGNGEIGLESVCSGGFLGFMKFGLEFSRERISVGVIPVVPDVSASSALIRSIANIVATTENEEDNETTMMFSSSTTPGYEHREYVPGDPLKRINWKLSSKKSALMVRLDEAAASVQPVIVLDLYRKENTSIYDSIVAEEKILSSAFGLLTALIRHGVACTFIFRGEGGVTEIDNVDNPDYPSQILLKVLACKVTAGERVDIRDYSDTVCACIIATTDAGVGFETITDKIGKTENVSIIGVSADSENSTSYPFWYLDTDNNFKMV